MSARENLLRKSCRAPADNHFIYVTHRQHSCGKKDLYQWFFTTDENITLSANTRRPSFLADRQSAVLRRASGCRADCRRPLPYRTMEGLSVIQEERLTNLNEPSLNSYLNC